MYNYIVSNFSIQACSGDTSLLNYIFGSKDVQSQLELGVQLSPYPRNPVHDFDVFSSTFAGNKRPKMYSWDLSPTQWQIEVFGCL